MKEYFGVSNPAELTRTAYAFEARKQRQTTTTLNSPKLPERGLQSAATFESAARLEKFSAQFASEHRCGLTSALRSLAFFIAALGILGTVPIALAQGMQPMVAIHDSELTRALENMSASGATPTGAGTTGKQWWPTNWHYFVMPESMKEALRSDGTAFTVVSDANISAGSLLQNGLPRYP